MFAGYRRRLKGVFVSRMATENRPDGSQPICVVLARDGVLGHSTLAVTGSVGQTLVCGTGARAAAEAVTGCRTVWAMECPLDDLRAVAVRIAEFVASCHLVIAPTAPDGRDIAALLAADGSRALLANCVDIHADGAAGRIAAVCVTHGGAAMVERRTLGPAVATVEPHGLVRPSPAAPDEGIAPEVVDVDAGDVAAAWNAARSLQVVEADAASIDLAEASRILGVGDGVGTADEIATAETVAELLGCALGATRVVTDSGLVSHARQIGTTGVVVAPELYLAFGVSGAVQHTAGLGEPRHIVSVNVDAHCPMMAMADLRVVADGPSTLAALQSALRDRAVNPVAPAEGAA